MDSTENLQLAERILAPWNGAASAPSPERLDLAIQADMLKPIVKALVQARWGYLAAITGLDRAAPKPPVAIAAADQPVASEPAAAQNDGVLEVLYHFARGACILTLRVEVQYANPTLPSICDLVPTATLFERELMEMFGITLPGTTTTDKLLLPDDWPVGVFPLRKSFQGLDDEAAKAKESE
jgi:Ni,Fe-hydrogenase III component G